MEGLEHNDAAAMSEDDGWRPTLETEMTVVDSSSFPAPRPGKTSLDRSLGQGEDQIISSTAETCVVILPWSLESRSPTRCPHKILSWK